MGLAVVATPPLAAQDGSVPIVSAKDSAALRDDVEQAVDTWERLRRRYAPTNRFAGSDGDGCDEYVGRMCLTFGKGTDWWFPDSIPERMEERRLELLRYLHDAVLTLPGDPWILGQLVLYLGEGGEWEDALPRLDPCPPVARWWCLALRGTALHAAARYEEATRTFAEALETMEAERRQAWLDPGEVIDRDLRRHLDTLGAPARAAALEAFWRFADPFLLVPLNDRWTEHLARRTLIDVRYGNESAYRLRFRDDLAEVTLRYGWEVGWERRPSWNRVASTEADVIGHHHPLSLPWVPRDEVALDPAASGEESWVPQSARVPRTAYAPLYAPSILPEGDVLVFPRGREIALVGAIALPTDTSWHAAHDHPPLPIPEPFASDPGGWGSFVLDVDGRLVAAEAYEFPSVSGREADADALPDPLPDPHHTLVRVPPGDYVVSVELLVPALSRGARMRRGLRLEERLLDQPTLSDLILLPPRPEPATLEEAVRNRVVRSVRPGDAVRVGWETWGIGRTRELLSYRLVLSDRGGGILRTVGGWFGLGDDGVVTDLEWTEPAPPRLGSAFRSVELSLPREIDPDTYIVRLELGLPGREILVAERNLVVRH
ncbi:MAG: hypothetical protein RQ745_09070 [Longimicrobiales bacterium]|nr:hypothetical protein [Longimicrobiales bacterium]